MRKKSRSSPQLSPEPVLHLPEQVPFPRGKVRVTGSATKKTRPNSATGKAKNPPKTPEKVIAKASGLAKETDPN
jgi:hypothetical protein